MGRHEQPVRRLRDPRGEVVKRWIVNPRTHEVTLVAAPGAGSVGAANAILGEGCFLYDAPTSADAAMAGRRHDLAVEALESLPEAATGADFEDIFKVVADRIEWSRADTSGALSALADLHNTLEARGFEVWREGLGLLVLARRVQGTEGIHAWVSEIGSDR